MPYIKKDDRVKVDSYIKQLVCLINRDYKFNNSGSIVTSSGMDGMVNYIITSIIDGVYNELSYHNFNSALGVLSAIEKEYYRRKVAPYEEKKRKQNGEVYNV